MCIGRPQNFVSSWLWMRSCFTYFVSFGGGIAGMIWSSVIAMAPLVRRVDGDLPRRRVEVARRQVPLLALAAVHRHLHGVAVAAREGLVAVEERLHRVGAGGDVRQPFDREADRRRPSTLAGAPPGQPSRSRPKIGCPPGAERHVEARLAVAARGEDEQQPAVERGLAARRRIADLEAQRAGRRRGLEGVERDEPGGKGGGGHRGQSAGVATWPECSRHAVTPPGLVASVP